MDIPFNITNEQSLDKWNVEAAERLRGISCYEHVVVFVTTHSDPDRGDLWAGQNSPKNRPKDPCAITVKNVSRSHFFFFHFARISTVNSTVARSYPRPL